VIGWATPPKNEAWRDRAACRGVDPSVFVRGRGESLAEAKAICATCPVTTQCLDDAGTEPGVWGRHVGTRT
jgi:WhiB family transcriptional regulator, redox-sensing transcriptional regulator